ncbi:hypothetical protein EAX61_03110 [Dokdonia sinensis]|uniref:SPOR domain-containing protein n=1 Tax=Dokdonia sinensis TaxID=2479847 RepID=A0A3M0H1B2_9FLAO|nr:hypothetical protein [Dokdonia sinensis]RMB63396.1 hypothetical protein EAX61_03110 [Dokdonia sinensis]
MKNYFFLILLLPILAIAQDSKTFTRDKEFYIRGNTKVIGNNILSKDATKPFDEDDRVNDEFKMQYVDIDNDESTYSSSSAYLDIDDDATIVYAGLYWTATYYGEKGVKKFKDNRTFYKKKEERAHDFQDVKFALPQGGYENVRGSLIFDGEQSRNKMLSSRSPYACVADVTALVKSQDKKTGMYTVANVSATEGLILGGSSAGWMLYVVYEQETEPLQYITTYHGFEFINKQPVEVEFGNFKSDEKGEVRTAVTVGALEGDVTLARDQIGIYNPKEDAFITLDNRVRASDNFFNSTITINDTIFTKRNPASRNTLGFDIAKLNIPNTENAVIANSSSGVKMQFKTRSDRYFLFFTAFQTTISEAFFSSLGAKENETEVEPSVEEDIAIAVKAKENTPITIDVLNRVDENTEEAEEKEEVDKPSSPFIKDPEVTRILEKPSVSIPEIGKGFYIVTNVFSTLENAEKWSTTLTERGFTPQTMLRPDNGLFYVFLNSGTDLPALYEELKQVRLEKDLDKAWMLKINME